MRNKNKFLIQSFYFKNKNIYLSNLINSNIIIFPFFKYFLGRLAMYNTIDLFCGAGGLSLGFEMAGFNVLAGFEIEPAFLETYRYSHPKTACYNTDLKNLDIMHFLNENNINTSEIDVVMGGPPCQGFSTVGRNKIDDPRNDLVKTFANIIGDIKPKMFLMENVAGLISMKNINGTLFSDELISLFDKKGYHVKFKILLAADYGVPQLRKRVFFVGIRKDFNYNFQFPKPTHFEKNSLSINGQSSYLTVKEAFSDLPVIDYNEFADKYDKRPTNEYQEYCRGNNLKLFNHKAPNHSQIVIKRIKKIPQGGNHNDLPDNLKLKSGYSNIYGKLEENKPADTITGNCGCASAPGRFLHPINNRVITVREAGRLQSFPDFVEFRGNTSQQYQQVGNAVPPLLAKSIALEMAKSISNFEP